jgi:hypothetical protein
MELTNQQKATLKTYIQSQPDLASMFVDGNLSGVADALNASATPAFWVYRTDIPSSEIGKTVNYVAVAAMTTANLQRISDFLRLNASTFNGRDDVKTFLSDTFSGTLGGQGQATRDALDLMLRRQVSRIERVFATGTGSTVAPGTAVVVGLVSYVDLIGL